MLGEGERRRYFKLLGYLHYKKLCEKSKLVKFHYANIKSECRSKDSFALT